jgi:hypothetical protein
MMYSLEHEKNSSLEAKGPVKSSLYRFRETTM